MSVPLYIIIPALGINALILFALGLYSFQRKDIRGSSYFSLLMLACGFWSIAQIGEYASTQLVYKITWSKISYLGISTVSVLFFLFALSYTKQGYRHIKKHIWLLWVVPFLVIILVFTNEWHGLIWNTITPVVYKAGVFLRYEYGLMFYLHVVYSYVLMLLGSFYFIKEVIITSKKQQYSIITLLVAVALPWIANILYLLKIQIVEGVELTSFVFMLTGVLIFINIFAFKFLHIVPAAKELVYRSLGVGILVLDQRHVVVDVNPVVQDITGKDIAIGTKSADITFGKKALETIIKAKKKHTIYQISENSWVSIDVDPLRDVFHKEMGVVVQLHDVTQLMENKKKLEYAHAFLTDVIDFLPDPTYVVDARGRVVIWNKALEKRSGVKAKDIVGKGNYAYRKALHGKRHITLIDYVLKEKNQEIDPLYEDVEQKDDMITARAHTSKTHPVVGKGDWWLIAQALRNKEGELLYAIESIRDISQLMKHQRDIQEKLTTITRMNKIMVNRELKMIELKKRIRELEGSSKASK
jgi:PAS domain-containing protein